LSHRSRCWRLSIIQRKANIVDRRADVLPAKTPPPIGCQRSVERHTGAIGVHDAQGRAGGLVPLIVRQHSHCYRFRLWGVANPGGREPVDADEAREGRQGA